VGWNVPTICIDWCKVYDWVWYSFNIFSLQLDAIPSIDLYYYSSLDFVGPLVFTSHEVKYVLMMVEHFSKWIEFVPLFQNPSELVANTFLDCILVYFWVWAKILTNKRREFLRSFGELYTKAFTNHRTTLHDHLETDGLAKCIVQMVEYELRNY